jgi:hypothetical protein
VADTPRLVTTLRYRLGDGPEFVVIWDTVEITVGRHPAQDLVVPDGDVSREHALFRRERASFVVEDRGTALGTRVNGQRVRSAALDAGDVVEVGRLRVEFHQTRQLLRAGGDVRFASELKADALALRGPGDRTMLGLELDDALASPVVAQDAFRAGGPRALSDDGALEDVPEIGDDLALPPEELEAWCAGGTAARDLDAELGLASGPAGVEPDAASSALPVEKEPDDASELPLAEVATEDDPNACTVRDARGLVPALAVGSAPAQQPPLAPPHETTLELALELRGPDAAVRGLVALLREGELPLGPVRLRLRGASTFRAPAPSRRERT